jgi:hypothetical protein
VFTFEIIPKDTAVRDAERTPESIATVMVVSGAPYELVAIAPYSVVASVNFILRPTWYAAVTSVGIVNEVVETKVGVCPRFTHSAPSYHVRTAAITSRAESFTPDGSIPSLNPLGDSALLLAAVVLHAEMFDIFMAFLYMFYMEKLSVVSIAAGLAICPLINILGERISARISKMKDGRIKSIMLFRYPK